MAYEESVCASYRNHCKMHERDGEEWDFGSPQTTQEVAVMLDFESSNAILCIVNNVCS